MKLQVIYKERHSTTIARPQVVLPATTFTILTIPQSVLLTVLTVQRLTGIVGLLVGTLAIFAAFLASNSAFLAACAASFSATLYALSSSLQAFSS